MPETLLQTKLYVPPLRPNLVPRAGLIERLNQGLQLEHKLCLISAPAGFGKTTLVVEWLRGKDDGGFAWLSLDEGDGDVDRFMTYLIAALQRVWGDIGQGALAMLESAQSAPAESVLTAVINEMACQSGGCMVVLDDYHLIQADGGGSAAVDDALAFLVERLPPQVHLVVVTREDPGLPLARLRASGQLTEIRAVDLRFSPAEAAEFFNRAMGLSLSTEEIGALERRTEGWIAGLQLAALALQGQSTESGHREAKAFIDSFSGSHHFVLDYLMEEVLEKQPSNIQRFLLQTAVLDRLNGALCDALTGRDDGREMLQAMERANLFIVGLDEERQWYRYHQLFGDLLRRRLSQQHPDWLPVLNGKASKWNERQGRLTEAIEYALRSGDHERTAQVLEAHLDDLWGSGEHGELQRWLSALPEEELFSRPQLAIIQARYQCSSGKLLEAEQTLAAAEEALAQRASEVDEGLAGQPLALSDVERSKLQGRALATRAMMASYQGDVAGIIHYAGQALERLAEDDLTWRSVTALTLGNTYGFQGDMPAAYDARSKALQSCLATGDRYFIVIANLQVAITLREQGRLAETIEICRQQSRLVMEFGLAQTTVGGWLLAIWGETLAEMNDLDDAVDRARRGLVLTEHGRDLQMYGWSVMCLVRTLFSRGELAEAREVIGQVEARARESQIPPWIANQMAMWQARLWLVEGKLAAASQWAKMRGLDAGGEVMLAPEIGFFLLYDYLALARILVAQGRPAEASRMLGQLLQAAEAGERTSSVIEVLMLQALAYSSSGDRDRAHSALVKALGLAQPLGFVRVFADEGRPMAALLNEMMAEDGQPVLSQEEGLRAYVLQILAALDGRVDDPDPEPAQLAPRGRQPLFEPLSERELEVLRLVAEGLTNREIGARLYLSLNTVKVHTRNIYGKLDVHNRTQAVAKAREFGILSSAS